MRASRRRVVMWCALYAAAYVGSAWMLSSSAFPSGYTPWYPPAGLTLAFLIIAGVKPLSISFVIGVRLLNTAIVFPDAWRDEADGVIARAVAISACYALAAWILRRVGLQHARLRELGWFAFVGVVGGPLGAALSVAVVDIVLLGSARADAVDAALTFWVGDAVAVASIVPAVLLVAAASRDLVTPPRLPRSRPARIETLLQAAALILVPVLVIAITERKGQSAYLVLTIAPVVWVALRRSIVVAGVGLFVLTATLSTVAARALEQDVALVELQTVLLAAALAGLYVAAATHGQEMAMADLIESEERYRSVISSAPDLVARFDANGALVFSSDPPWLADAGGATAVLDELQSRWNMTSVGVDDDGVHSLEWERDDVDGVRAFSARLAAERRADGGRAGVIAVVTDLTGRRRAEAEREEAKRHDPLTGLTNRSGLLELLAALHPDDVADRLAMIVVDLDQFKTVNGVRGHEQGDEILRCVAARVADAEPSALAAARVGGDEFALALLVDAGETAVDTAERVLTDIRACIPIGEDEHFLTASAGIAVGGPPGASPEDVFCDAEAAMHGAKEAGRDRVAHFDADRRSLAADRRACESLLRLRLNEGAVVVHYQPAFDLRSGKLRAIEALVRLHGHNGEIVMPERFIPIAEDAGLDVDLGSLVLEEVLRQLEAWTDPSLVVHVNITARQLTRSDFASQVLDACRRHGVASEQLCLELTETLVMVDPEAAIVALTELRADGVRASLDDFGTGYSSIAYLSRLPVSGLKIDRAFVARLPDDLHARAVVGLVAGLGKALHLDVIAEGIETEAQTKCLLDLGCERGQGFLLARPAPPDDIAALLVRDGAGAGG